MQTTILTCDWCRGAKGGLPVFAVGTFTLQNGRRAKAPTLDLCARCQRRLERLFQPTSAKKAYSTGGPKHRAAVDARAARHEATWKEREKAMLAVLKGKAEGLDGPELCKAAKMSKHYVYKVAKRLLEAGKVRRARDGGRMGFVLA